MNIKILALAATFSTFASAYANETLMTEGRYLFEEAQCMACHQARPFNGPNTKVKSLSGLRAMVEACNTNLSVGWFPDEVQAVTHYLNKTHYNFPALKQAAEAD